MTLKSLHLKDFRNYRESRFCFGDAVNVIVGENAQGKTNLLESIYFLSRGSSHRTNSRRELIRFDQETALVEGEIRREDVTHEVRTTLTPTSKVVSRDGKKHVRQSEISTDIFNVILFEPEDLRIVKAGPDRRRRFLDTEIAAFLPGYLPVLREYQRILKQRAALLREVRYDMSLMPLLDSWDPGLIQNGARLMAYRINYLKRLDRYAGVRHARLSGEREKLRLYYQTNVLDSLAGIDLKGLTEAFRLAVQQSREMDIERGSNTCGPHMDDLRVEINGRDARHFASQGQQRTAAIALKLSQIDISREITGEAPVVLLDDILSELDVHRRERILTALTDTQCFITCTNADFVERFDPESLRLFVIEDGQQKGK